MAWVETRTLKSGEKRYRVVERAPDGRVVKGPLMHSQRDAERLAGKTGLDKQREELELVKKDYRIRDVLEELPDRFAGSVTDNYIQRYRNLSRHLLRFLDTRARSVKKLSQLTKPVLLEYRSFRLEEATRPPQRRVEPPPEDAFELTVAQAALVLGYTHSATLRLLQKPSVLRARKVAHGNRVPHYLITRESLDSFMKSKRYERGRLRAAKNAARRAEAKASKPKNGRRYLKNRTINLEISMIQTLLNKAVEWGLIDDSPIRSTKGLKLPEHDSKQFRALTDREFDRFRRTCPAWLMPPLMAASLLGLREEEIRQLEWSDVDLAERILRVRDKEGFHLKSQGYTGIRQFQMQIPGTLFTLLSELYLQKDAFEDDFVFHNTHGHQFPKGALRKLFIEVMQECDIHDVTQVHALRKTFITHMARRVNNVFLLQELARHKDIRTTQRYVNIFEEDKKSALEDFDIGSSSARRDEPPATIGDAEVGAG
ncbi:tyrosine-type recombinase/integrase [Planctomycetota bacterium]